MIVGTGTETDGTGTTIEGGTETATPTEDQMTKKKAAGGLIGNRIANANDETERTVMTNIRRGMIMMVMGMMTTEMAIQEEINRSDVAVMALVPATREVAMTGVGARHRHRVSTPLIPTSPTLEILSPSRQFQDSFVIIVLLQSTTEMLVFPPFSVSSDC